MNIPGACCLLGLLHGSRSIFIRHLIIDVFTHDPIPQMVENICADIFAFKAYVYKTIRKPKILFLRIQGSLPVLTDGYNAKHYQKGHYSLFHLRPSRSHLLSKASKHNLRDFHRCSLSKRTEEVLGSFREINPRCVVADISFTGSMPSGIAHPRETKTLYKRVNQEGHVMNSFPAYPLLGCLELLPLWPSSFFCASSVGQIKAFSLHSLVR